jgi:alpha-D-ribose 1-methylphosphonate 5-triphosphate synthase subunit PhnH
MTALSPGFADPVFDAQAVFKAIMMAMARPAEIRRIKPALRPPSPLTPAAAAVALALLDYETPFWLDALLAAPPEPAQWIKFHTGARITSDKGQAAFAFVSAPLGMPPLNDFALGTLEYPDRSATIVVQVDSLEGGRPLVLSGPGIESTRAFSPEPLPIRIVDQLAENAALFPRGVEMIFAAPDAIAALPRSIRIRGNG